jgi:hypothetical protein
MYPSRALRVRAKSPRYEFPSAAKSGYLHAVSHKHFSELILRFSPGALLQFTRFLCFKKIPPPARHLVEAALADRSIFCAEVVRYVC